MGPEYDELYVISDLHFGGKEGDHIFTEGDLLKETINYFKDQDADKRVALCLNGDTIDFLAEENATYFNIETAEQTIQSIMNDRQPFSGVFKSLSKFVQTKNRFLIFVTGNHDIELTLPQVQEALFEYLCKGSKSGDVRGRIIFADDGSGFRCRVGVSEVLCLHGAFADTWNAENYDRMRKIVRDLKFNIKPRPMISSPGRKMVIDVINDVKKDQPFVELMKPLVEAALPVLTSLKPSVKKYVGKISKLVLEAQVKGRLTRRFLSSEDEGDWTSLESSMLREDDFDEYTGGAGITAPLTDTEEIMKEVEADLERGVRMDEVINGIDSDDTLGWTGLLIPALSWRKSTVENLQDILEDMAKKDTNFDVGAKDGPYKWIEDNLNTIENERIDFLVCGHTHLRKAIRVPGMEWTYLNSGTWVNLIPFSNPEMLRAFAPDLHGKGLDPEKLEELLKKIDGKSVDDLRKIKKPVEICRTIPTVVKVAAEKGDRAQGCLMEYTSKGWRPLSEGGD